MQHRADATTQVHLPRRFAINKDSRSKVGLVEMISLGHSAGNLDINGRISRDPVQCQELICQ